MEGALNNAIEEFFGPRRRRPLKSNTLSAVARIYSLFPDQNPFAQFTLPAQTPDDVGDSLAPVNEKEARGEVGGSANVEVQDSPSRIEVNNGGNAGISCEGGRFNVCEKVTDESGRTNQTETVDTIAFVNKEAGNCNAVVRDVQEGLLGIERVLMEDSDDVVGIQLPEVDFNFDIFNDRSSVLDKNVLSKDTMPVEGNGSGKLPTEGNIKDDVVGKKKRKEVEIKESSFVGDVASHVLLPVEREFSNCSGTADQSADPHPENVGRKERKLCKDKVPQDLLKMEGLNVSAERREKGGMSVSVDKFVDSFKKGREPGSVDKGKKGKIKKGKKADLKEVKIGKTNSLDVEASNSTKSEDINPVAVHGKMSKQIVFGKKNLSTREGGKCWPKCRENIHYSRQQLLQLQQVAAVPGNILKAVQEIGADLLGGNQNSAPRIPIHGSCSNERQPVIPSEDMKVDKTDSGLMKNKKRGSSSEARKEKKKKKKRQKRAELNKKLGVRRLKLRPPVLKPKVAQHCRHYVRGRCQEGEKCKFSHDVIPLTKSTPCCHFARQSCMKGDDCPFDHQLSKYPCNNYVATGFCGRGDGCLFSHKIQDKEGLERRMGVSKEIKGPDQLDKHCDANASSSLKTAALKNLVISGTKTCQPAQVPKGLSFLSFGKSPLDDITRHKESVLPLQNCDSAGAGHQPKQPQSGRSIGLGKTLEDHPVSTASLGIGLHASEKTLVDSPAQATANNKQVEVYRRRVNPVGTANLLSQGASRRGADLCETFKDSQAVANPRGLSFPASGGPSYDKSGDKIQTISATNGLTNARTPFTEKKSTSETRSIKAAQPEPLGSPASSGQCPIRVGGAVKSTPQRALLSTLAFAAKYESGIKIGSASATKEVDKNEGTSSSNGGRQNEATKASSILEFLYSGVNKQKQ